MNKSSGPRLSAVLTNQDSLSEAERDSLFEIFAATYDAVTRERFLSDLSKKALVLLIQNESGENVGFTTFDLLVDVFEGQKSYALFSGDTVIQKEHRGEHVLALSWIRTVAAFYAALQPAPFYWFLIVKGEKTYRYLPAFFQNYTPSLRADVSIADKELLRRLAKTCFGEHFNPLSGVVEFPESQGHLKDFEAAIPEHKLKNPEIAFFLEKNPGYARGHELACLARITTPNFRPWGRKVFEIALKTPFPLVWDPVRQRLQLATNRQPTNR
jgi:hypothetical protein